MGTVIYHNPSCSKSRESLAALQQLDSDAEIIEYLKDPPTAAELQKIIELLGIRPEALVRKGEAAYLEHFKGKTLSDAEWVKAMADFPKLIERPIVIHDGKAAIGRPVEKVIALFKQD